MRSLTNVDLKTNILVCSVPYRYDDPALNENISYANAYLSRAMTVAFGWLFGLTLGLVVLIGPYNTALLGYVYDPVEAAMYSAFSPILWCTFISWGVLASHYGYGGWFGKFLSWKYFKVFTRLAYAIYLTQFPVFFYNVGTTKAALYYSSLDLVRFLLISN
ncbi:O-acyltransferase like protein-like [Nilaparvata lugens]|uniref:O-acyltransferase like protein-like n=1 Tax=Nilaparvata lugens TaxID=108931 RepID=UPI00193D316E|nr:O-acyltransferase like protein-like [Nilaparvata lugens]